MPSQIYGITVLLADDEPLARAGIRALLERANDIRIIGEAKDGFEVQRLVADLHPQILLLDLRMPGPSPFQLERWVRENYPETVTLVLTAHDRDAYLAGMMDAGATGFLDKDVQAEQLIGAIRRAAHGENLIDETQVSRIEHWHLNVEKKWESLTDREHHILQLLIQGMSNKQIAISMGIDQKTVEQHLTSIYSKLGVTSRAEAILWGIAQSRDFPD